MFAFNARKRFAGIRLSATDADFSVGSGRLLTGPIRDIVLALSGRPATLAGASTATATQE